MSKILTTLLLLIGSYTMLGQNQVQAPGGVNFSNGNLFLESSGSPAPTGSCVSLSMYIQTTAPTGKNIWQCVNGGWVQQAAGSSVASVFTRTGAVTAQSGDYTVSQVTGAAPLASPTFTGTVTSPAFTDSGVTGSFPQCAEFTTGGVLAGTGSACGAGGSGVSSFAAPSGSWPSWLVPTVANPTSTPSLAVAASAIPNASLATQTANTVLGALTATTPSGLAVPSCSGASNALIWTSGTGFGCNTISGGGTIALFVNSVLVTGSLSQGSTTINGGSL